MQQRRLRLGDILDDYCPRERRVTNHVVVAMVEDDVKQTRCSTCDAEHEYKQAKIPAPRRKKAAAALADVGDQVKPRVLAPGPQPPPAAADEPPAPAADTFEPSELSPKDTAAEPETDIEPAASDQSDEEWPVHRPLIRAT